MMLGAGPNLTPFPNSIILRDGHCHNHGRLPARDPIYLAPTNKVQPERAALPDVEMNIHPACARETYRLQ
jgi:hypothetical protein